MPWALIRARQTNNKYEEYNVNNVHNHNLPRVFLEALKDSGLTGQAVEAQIVWPVTPFIAVMILVCDIVYRLLPHCWTHVSKITIV